MKKVLIVRGGWEGHEPVKVSEIFRDLLQSEGFDVCISDTLDVFKDEVYINNLHLIVPVWTMGKITNELIKPVIEAVASGVGIAGCHGGMCDAFRESTQWQFMTGGQWVSHPGGDGVEYTVNIKNSSSSIVEGIHDFNVKSEQYYVHIDPSIEILATTRFPVINWYHSTNKPVDVPVLWTKRWGYGRVFYSALGHHADVFDIYEALETMKRGFLWAAEGKDIAIKYNLSAETLKSSSKMF